MLVLYPTLFPTVNALSANSNRNVLTLIQPVGQPQYIVYRRNFMRAIQTVNSHEYKTLMCKISLFPKLLI